MKNLRDNARYWIIGIALAVAGVSANRVFAPHLDTRPRAVVALAGELVALAGLGVIIFGINRRLRLAGQAANPDETSPPENRTISRNPGHP